MGKTSHEVGGRVLPIRDVEGRNLDQGCERPDKVVIVGRRICCTALVTRLADRRGLGSGAGASGWNERVCIFLLS